MLSSVNPLGDVKIVDFGMSRKLENCSELRQIMGTTEYLGMEELFAQFLTCGFEKTETVHVMQLEKEHLVKAMCFELLFFLV